MQRVVASNTCMDEWKEGGDVGEYEFSADFLLTFPIEVFSVVSSSISFENVSSLCWLHDATIGDSSICTRSDIKNDNLDCLFSPIQCNDTTIRYINTSI